MSGNFYLDWAIASVSLFNTILTLWLGFTILLNAERRNWGMWLASGGLLMGGAFFFSHSAILGHGMDYLGRGIDFWWRIGWTLVITLPFIWYVIMLWYAGFWDERHNNSPGSSRKQRLRLLFPGLLVTGWIMLLVLAHTLPSFAEISQTRTPNVMVIGNLPLMALLYPLYIILCIGLSLDALLRPGPSDRTMGDLARHRARPWLVGTSVVLLIVSVMVTWVMVWTLMHIGQRALPSFYSETALILAQFDLLISALIAVAVILLGQAIVSYEVFTGKTLPRRGFRRYWRRAIALAAGYGTLVGWSLTIQLRPAYSFLLTTLLLVVFYAILSWRSFAERERIIDQLRPFVASQQLYENLLSGPAASLALDVETPFRALCEDVLGARTVYLAATGALSGLFGPPLVYPRHLSNNLPDLEDILSQFDSPHQMCIALDPARHGAATWAVPLWSERGLIGVLLLGEKRDGGLYTQEEIEIARAIGERLIDTQASAEMAHRLMALQRRQLAETQVLDRQTRRALHDDILPQLHTAMLALSNAQDAAGKPVSKTLELLAQTHRQISELLRGMPATSTVEVSRSGVLGALRKVIEGEFRQAFDDVSWQIDPQAEQKAVDIPPLTAEVFFYAARESVRNAARHGRDGRTGEPLNLKISALCQDGLVIRIEDDGVGANLEARQGEGGQAKKPASHEKFVPQEGSGRGLALHSTMVAIVGGSLEFESEPGMGTRVTLKLPGM